MKLSRVWKWNPWGWFPPVLLAMGFALIQVGQWNTPLFYSLNRLPWPWVWTNLTELGDGLIIGILLFPFIRKRPQILTAFLLGIALNTIIVQGLKSYFHLPRPAGVLNPESFRVLGPVLKARAFPSGHSATVFLTAGILVYFLKNKSIRYGLLILAFLVAISRVAVGAHWPQDVLLGSLLGWIVGWLVAAFVNRYRWYPQHPRGKVILGGIYFIAGAGAMALYPARYPFTQITHYLLPAVAWGWGIKQWVEIIRLYLANHRDR